MHLSDFKIGQKVKFKDTPNNQVVGFSACDESKHGITNLGETYFKEFCTVYGFYKDKVVVTWTSANNESMRLAFDPSSLSFISNFSLMSDIMKNFALAFKPEPQRSFRKAGITNGDDILTDEGVKIFLTWMLKAHEEKFKTEVVDDILKEMKESKS